jgi:hypothetical protein
MRYTTTIALAALFLTIGHAGEVRAQSVRSTPKAIVAVTGTSYGTWHPEGSALAFGALIGYERKVASRIALRADAAYLSSIFPGDVTSICHPLPGGGCLDNGVLPGRVWLGGLQAVTRVGVSTFPLYLLTGAALALPVDPRMNRTKRSPVDSAVHVHGTWRAGLELGLGSSPRAPRAQFLYHRFPSAVWSLSSLKSVGLIFPF